MRNQDDRALVIVDRLDEFGAAVDVEVVRGLVEDQELRPVEGREPHKESRLLAARQRFDISVGARTGKADQRRPPADLRFRLPAHALGDMAVGRAARGQVVDLVLGEEADLELVRPHHFAAHRRQPPTDELGEGRLAVAVRAQEPDPVVVRERQVDARQHRPVAVAGADLLHGHDRRREFLGDRRPFERHDRVVDDRRDRLHPGQHLEPGLRLDGFARFGAKTVDERLQMGAPLLLFLQSLALQDLLFATLPLEARVAAAPEGELAAVEVKDVVGHVVEQVAVVADDQDRRGAGLEVVGEPQDAFEVEVVRRLVEEQEVGLGKKHGGERDAHAPAAGELGRARDFAPPRRSRGRLGSGLRGQAPRGRRCRPAASGSRRSVRGRSPFRPLQRGRPVRRQRPARTRSGPPVRPAPPARRCRAAPPSAR